MRKKTDTVMRLLAADWTLADKDKPASDYDLSQSFYENLIERNIGFLQGKNVHATKAEILLFSGLKGTNILNDDSKELSQLTDIPIQDIYQIRALLRKNYTSEKQEPAPQIKAPVQKVAEEVAPKVQLKDSQILRDMFFQSMPNNYEPASTLERIATILYEVAESKTKIEKKHEEVKSLENALGLNLTGLVEAAVQAEKDFLAKRVNNQLEFIYSRAKDQMLINQVKENIAHMVMPPELKIPEKIQPTQQVDKVKIYADFGNNGYKTANRAAEQINLLNTKIEPVLIPKNINKVSIPPSTAGVIVITDSVSHTIEESIRKQCEKHSIYFGRSKATLESVKEAIQHYSNRPTTVTI
jgi:hypothetical protein